MISCCCLEGAIETDILWQFIFWECLQNSMGFKECLHSRVIVEGKEEKEKILKNKF